MNTLNPPALVRQAEDLETCLANAQSHAKRIVQDAVAAGEWLIKAKAACPHGQWLSALEKYGFTPRTAQRLMETARRKGEIRQVSHLFDMEPGDEVGESFCRKGIEHFRKCGELLLEAKAKLRHGEWLAWVEKNLRFTERQARRYMALAKSDAASDFEEAWRILLGHDGARANSAG